MKINWKLPLAVVVIAAGATGLALNNWTEGSGCRRLEATLPVDGPWPRKPSRTRAGSNIGREDQRSLGSNDHARRRSDQGNRREDSRCQETDGAMAIEVDRHDRLRPGDRDRRPHSVRQPR